MKTNLSSQIKLDLVPKRYYAPENKIEYASLCREEKVFTHISETTDDGVKLLADEVVATIKKNVEKKGKCVIALGTGNSVLPVYAELINRYENKKVDFADVVVFNLFEFYPTEAGAPSTLDRLNNLLLSKVNIKPENVHSFNQEVEKADLYEGCRAYEAEIDACGGLDLVLCEIGAAGNLAFNAPGSQFSSACRMTLIDSVTRRSVSSAYDLDVAPATAITLGIGNILAAKKVLAMAWGENQAKIVKAAVEDKASETVPASFLQMHRNAKVVVDLSAAERLTRICHPWLVTSCEWNNKMIRRAIAWLCEKTGKPILKLTSNDYNEYGLNELAAQFGSAYNVNIKVFNDIQHTITGWPGGKPDADDTDRPERAKPYPKRVIVFSPHPDDDVISMGGTLKRLVDQKHDVHVAYETSGNIAVGDEEVIRFLHFINGFNQIFNNSEDQVINDKYTEIRKYLKEKKDGDMDTRDILTIKGLIRRGEARTACTYNNIPLDHCHFLDLPFYETGKIQKNPISEADVEIVRNLLREVKPHQIFVAGDLADPHGTHRVCTDAVFAAIDLEKEEGAKWLKECRIWMYRGAWAEWEIENIEMAVPISPEELRAKRNSILKHQSQMESAPFLGNDERLFWQRSEDRNRGTAALYDSLGLASYEAMEAFVEYIPL